MQRIDRNRPLADARPDVARGPAGDRIHLHETEFVVGLDDRGAGALRCLVAPDRGDPGIEEQQLPPERLHLAQLAASVRSALPERGSVPHFLLRQRERRLDAADPDAVPLFQPTPELHRLGKEQPRVEREHVDGELLAADDVEEHAAFRTERRGETDAPGETARGPAEHRFGRSAFQLRGRRRDLGGAHRATSRSATRCSCRLGDGSAVNRTPTVKTMVARTVRSDRSGTAPERNAPTITPGIAPARTTNASAGSSRPANPWPVAATSERTNACARSVPTSSRARSGKNRARTKSRIDPLPTVVMLTTSPVANPIAIVPARRGAALASSGKRRRYRTSDTAPLTSMAMPRSRPMRPSRAPSGTSRSSHNPAIAPGTDPRRSRSTVGQCTARLTAYAPPPNSFITPAIRTSDPTAMRAGTPSSS